MLRLLRVKGTDLYFKGDGSLTQTLDEAMRFPDFSSAHRFCRKLELKNVELVLRVGPRQKEIILSMSGNGRKPPGQPGEEDRNRKES